MPWDSQPPQNTVHKRCTQNTLVNSFSPLVIDVIAAGLAVPALLAEDELVDQGPESQHRRPHQTQQIVPHACVVVHSIGVRGLGLEVRIDRAEDVGAQLALALAAQDRRAAAVRVHLQPYPVPRALSCGLGPVRLDLVRVRVGIRVRARAGARVRARVRVRVRVGRR